MCLPVLMLLIFGCYEFAKVNMTRNTVQAAAYEGARTGIVPGATVADVEASARFVLTTTGITNYSIQVTPNPIPLRSRQVTVEITVAPRDNTLAPMVFSNSIQLRGECSLEREGGF